ncbi:MAG: anthranilate phosphoribosyltransferase [Nitrospiraceae bacterium]
MQTFIAKVGKGAKTSKDLTWDEAKQAMSLLIEGTATPAQTGAFLMAMRMKGESVGELAAFTAVARQYVPPLAGLAGLNMVDVPCYAGKRDTFYAGVGAAIVAASAGASVLVHGWEGTPERPGPMAVLGQLGIPTDLGPLAVSEALLAKGFAYLDMANYHPPLARFLDLRRELGLRNCFHPVARMINPARARCQVIGMAHPPYFDKTVEAMNMLGASHAMVMRGVEGEPELSIASLTRIVELRDGRLIPVALHPKDVGLSLGTTRDMAGFAPSQRQQEAALLVKILQGEVKGGPRDWVVLNAAMLLYGSGVIPSIAVGVPLANEMIDRGAARDKLRALAEIGAATPGSRVRTG